MHPRTHTCGNTLLMAVGTGLGEVLPHRRQGAVGQVCRASAPASSSHTCLVLCCAFCSKWYEVMPGRPWDNLQELIEAKKVQGEWPMARDHWGSYRNKLETVRVHACIHRHAHGRMRACAGTSCGCAVGPAKGQDPAGQGRCIHHPTVKLRRGKGALHSRASGCTYLRVHACRCACASTRARACCNCMRLHSITHVCTDGQGFGHGPLLPQQQHQGCARSQGSGWRWLGDR